MTRPRLPAWDSVCETPHFQGRLTYAAIPVERVNWAPFDIVSLELIRSAEVADQFRAGVRSLVAELEGRNGDTYPDMAWEPKAAFTLVAECYAQ